MRRPLTGRQDGEDGEAAPLTEVTDAVRTLVEVMRANGLTELDVTSGSVAIRLRAPKSGAGGRADRDAGAASPIAAALGNQPIGHLVTAPMIGTFYSSPSPGEPPYVQVGDPVTAGQTIGIIEAMKIMNEIVADRSGVVAEVIAKNAQAVEYGSPLLRLEPSRDGDE